MGITALAGSRCRGLSGESESLSVRLGDVVASTAAAVFPTRYSVTELQCKKRTVDKGRV